MRKQKPYSERKRRVSLTNEQWTLLAELCRERARDAEESRDFWRAKAMETTADGQRKYQAAPRNAKYYTQLISNLAQIAAEIDTIQR